MVVKEWSFTGAARGMRLLFLLHALVPAAAREGMRTLLKAFITPESK